MHFRGPVFVPEKPETVRGGLSLDSESSGDLSLDSVSSGDLSLDSGHQLRAQQPISVGGSVVRLRLRLAPAHEGNPHAPHITPFILNPIYQTLDPST